MKVSLDTVRAVARLLNESSLAEIVLETTDDGPTQLLRVRRTVGGNTAKGDGNAVSPIVAPTVVVTPGTVAAGSSDTGEFSTPISAAGDQTGTATATNGEEASSESGSPAPERVIVRASAVGVFHLPPQGLNEGDIITARQAVGIIESLKIPNEVFAPVDAHVVEVLAREGEGVGYDHPLVLIEPLIPPASGRETA